MRDVPSSALTEFLVPEFADEDSLPGMGLEIDTGVKRCLAGGGLVVVLMLFFVAKSDFIRQRGNFSAVV